MANTMNPTTIHQNEKPPVMEPDKLFELFEADGAPN